MVARAHLGHGEAAAVRPQRFQRCLRLSLEPVDQRFGLDDFAAASAELDLAGLFGEGSRTVRWRHVRAAINDTPAVSALVHLWVWAALACVAGSGIGWMMLR